MKIYRRASGELYQAEKGGDTHLPDSEVERLARDGTLAQYGIDIATYGASPGEGMPVPVLAPVPESMMNEQELQSVARLREAAKKAVDEKRTVVTPSRRERQ